MRRLGIPEPTWQQIGIEYWHKGVLLLNESKQWFWSHSIWNTNNKNTLIECSNRSLFKFPSWENDQRYPYEIFTLSFQEHFLSVATHKSWHLFTNHSCETRLFLRFTARASLALTISQFKLDILHDSETSHQKNRKYCAICNQVMQYTVLNNGCLNSFNR